LSRAFSRAVFSDDGDGFPLFDGKRNAVQAYEFFSAQIPPECPDGKFLQGIYAVFIFMKTHTDVFYFKNFFRHRQTSR